MKPPGSSSRRPPVAGCSLPRASSGPRGGPAGPAPARALARVPPRRLLLVLLLLPSLAASSRPRAWGAAAPSGGYGPGALRIALVAGPCRGKRRAPESVRSGQVPGSAFPRLSAYRSPSLVPKPPFVSVHFLKPLCVAFTETLNNYCRFHWKVFSGCGDPRRNLAEGNPVDGKCREGASCFLGGGA